MNTPNRVRVDIGGAKYTISTPEPEEYVEGLGKELNELVSGLMSKGPNISLNNALVLSALHYMDLYKKSEANSDHLRSQVTDYLEDAARSRIDIEEARREVERLKRELNARR